MIASLPPSRFLPAPAPPHDPFSVMLAGHIGPSPDVGWRLATRSNVESVPGDGALVLSPSPAASRWLSEPNGSFGGLRPPSNVAVTATGDIFLLDRVTGEIRRFDPCDCRFVHVPCAVRVVEPCAGCEQHIDTTSASAPRDRLLDPQAIAVCAGDLFIADRGHHRVVRYAVGSWIPRGVLRLPPSEQAALGATAWAPYGLAVDGRGTLYVSDPQAGRIDRFTSRGRWVGVVTVESGVSHLAVDCEDTVHAVVRSDLTLAVPSSANVRTIEFDAGSDGYQWHTLALSPMGGARLSIDIHVGDEPWTQAYRDDPTNPRWSRWLDADAARRAVSPVPLAERAGRFLRLRFTPVAGHVPTAFTATARGARIRRVVGDSTEIVRNARAGLIGGFGRPPIVVDGRGRLHLPCQHGTHVFDEHGEPVDAAPDDGDHFEREGRYLSDAIDSRIDGCIWHRVELRGAIPPGCGVDVLTTTAEIQLTRAEIAELPPEAWHRHPSARSMAPMDRQDPTACAWDALIGGEPGRYLWLQLVLRGEGRTTPCVSEAVIEYPRISLRRYLPGVFGIDPASADFTDRFTTIFDRTVRSIESRLDLLPQYFDPLSAPARTGTGRGKDFLSWLGDWVGVTLARDWPEARRRRYLKEVARLYCQRGTPDGLRQQLLLLLGFDTAYGDRCRAVRPQCRCTPRARNCGTCPPRVGAEPPPLLLEHFKLRRWLYAGHGRLGDDSVLWGKQIVGRSELSGASEPPSGNAQVGVTRLDTVPDPLRDPFHVFAHRFSVFVPACIRDDAVERRALEGLLAREAPAHTQFDIRYVEPRYRVGVQASIGLDGVIARTPHGVTLDRSRLRQGTVLSGRAHRPDLEVGDSRVGTTTRLT